MDIKKEYHIKAKKSLGQNFLIDKNILDEIILSNDIEGKKIVEIGPGYGALSERILKERPSALEMIELDSKLVQVLEKRLEREEWGSFCDNIEIKNIDVLDYFDVPEDDYKVIANIPYYITSPILDHFFYRVKNLPISMTILMQKDVADKVLKQYHHKKPKSSVLSLFIAKKADVTKVCDVGAHCFDPIPKVDSSVLRFDLSLKFPEVDDELFLVFIKKAFAEPRKKLISNLLKSGYTKELLEEAFHSHKIGLTLRPEDIDISLYCLLFLSLYK